MKDLEQEESLADWLPAALLFVTLVIGLVIVFGLASCARTDATPLVLVPVTTDGGLPACKSADPHPLPGSCGRLTTPAGGGSSYYCTLCLDDEKCVSPKLTYCVSRALACDDDHCK